MKFMISAATAFILMTSMAFADAVQPFGFERGVNPSTYEAKKNGDGYTWIVDSAPNPHPDFALYGLYATRTFPRKLTSLNEEVIYERIPAFRRELARHARTIVLEACQSTPVLANFYVNRLSRFFETRRSLAYMVHPTGRTRRQLVAELEDLDRFLAGDDRRVSRELAIMVRKKDDLDYHRVMQGKLKMWLFVHIAMTYSLLIFAVVHGILAHAFSGGLG